MNLAAGVVLAVSGLLLFSDYWLPAEFMRPPPGRELESAYFRVSPTDQSLYKVSLYGDRFVMNFDATVLYPGKQKPPEFRGTDLPYLAVVWAGTPKTDGRYELLTAKEPICAGALLPINLRQSQEFENWGQSRLENIVTGATPEAPRPAYKNKDDTWFVSCNSITCTNIFLNATWTAELIVLENDVCASSMMNGNLRQIVDPWVKKAIQ